MASQLPALDAECFFIAPIGAEGSPERKRSDGVLDFIVGRAADELGLSAVRADKIAEPGQITLQVVEHVLGARAAVVDLTDLNPNVFYELAIRHTARLPVALIAEKDCTLPFDIAQMRTIFFDHTDLHSADACRRQIVDHLREALDSGAVDSPIATAVDMRVMQSGSAVERSIADLVSTVEDVARSQRSILSMVDRDVDWLRSREPRLAPRAVHDLLRGYAQLQRLALERGDTEVSAIVEQIGMPIHYLEDRVLDASHRHPGQSERALRLRHFDVEDSDVGGEGPSKSGS